MARAPRQADIAAAAGVSQTTVSLVLSGNTDGLRLAEATRQRVLEAAEQLGYVPDPVATRLASASNRMLGVYTFASAFPTAVDGFYYPILAGIEAEAAALGQDLVLFTGTGGRGEPPDHRAAIRRTRIADGCLFFGRHVPEEPIDWLLGVGFPLVYVGRRDELGGRIPYVGADYVAASAAVIERLVGLGHRQIRYLRSPVDALSSTDREQGVLAGLSKARLPVRRAVVRAEGVDAALIRSWMDDGVTAVVVEETDTGDLSAAALAAISEAGVSLPEDLSIAVLGQPRDRPDVTGFEVPRWELGRRAVRLLVDQISGARRSDQQLLECRPIPGSTVGPPGTTARRR
ncbi:LacI family transcriptional regulator [Kribbella sp. ALI-6-A]|uniref:LacI family DNA-binding transcriptional regulator n=1 Tax=Kribbella sp. ALI-6-A TaxID=1933817 RepID=UPI00097C611A|nr:LacI family DNA-binding transcriptional regulator [Kribbella sp. ALI-6-A]ONI71760.1 LacI family transcriptional regulator [Kribbella sp. ALI-6-A]